MSLFPEEAGPRERTPGQGGTGGEGTPGGVHRAGGTDGSVCRGRRGCPHAPFLAVSRRLPRVQPLPNPKSDPPMDTPVPSDWEEPASSPSKPASPDASRTELCLALGPRPRPANGASAHRQAHTLFLHQERDCALDSTAF